MGNHRRTFTCEFKVETIKLVTEQGRSFAEADRAFPDKGNLPALEKKLRRPRAETKRLQMERDMLKKAMVFFAKESL